MLPQPYYQDESCTIYHSDCREVLPYLPKVDLVLTDPPYGARRSGGVGKYGREKFCGARDLKWDDAVPTAAFLEDLCKIADAAILWGGNYFTLPPSRMFIVWDKGAGFRGRDFAECEQAWCSWDGNAKGYIRDPLAARDCIGKQHPTEKPVSLMTWCLSLRPTAELVLDPFMGSGTTLVAAKQAGKRCIGIERELLYCEAAVSRLRQESLFVLERAEPLSTTAGQIMLGARDTVAEEAFE